MDKRVDLAVLHNVQYSTLQLTVSMPTGQTDIQTDGR